MFRITMGKGFSIKFENGYRISVQFGPMNYCDNESVAYDLLDQTTKMSHCNLNCPNAEIAIIDSNENFHRPEEWDDDVNGYLRPDEVLAWMNYTAALPPIK